MDWGWSDATQAGSPVAKSLIWAAGRRAASRRQLDGNARALWPGLAHVLRAARQRHDCDAGRGRQVLTDGRYRQSANSGPAIGVIEHDSEKDRHQ